MIKIEKINILAKGKYLELKEVFLIILVKKEDGRFALLIIVLLY